MALPEVVADVMTRLLGRRYLESQYREMHAEGAFPGNSWRYHVKVAKEYIPELASMRIVDFGCGPLGGVAGEFGDKVISYDPYVEQFSTPPWDQPFDVLFTTDVIEHMPLDQVDEMLARVRDSSARYLFANISIRKAFKRLPNGANAHMSVRPARFWLDRFRQVLGSSFQPLYAAEDLLRSEVTLCFGRDASCKVDSG
ncbi:MAG: hypothetical protein U1D30_25180 [Planctomycetota bacterium]